MIGLFIVLLIVTLIVGILIGIKICDYEDNHYINYLEDNNKRLNKRLDFFLEKDLLEIESKYVSE